MSQLQLSSVVGTMTVKVKQALCCKCKFLFQSISVEAAHLILEQQTVYLSFLYLLLIENAMNCFPLNPLPPKHQMNFFHEQIRLRVAPHQNFQMVFLSLSNQSINQMYFDYSSLFIHSFLSSKKF